MLHLKNGVTIKDFEGYTVLIPSFSIGNSSQLALDVLIASTKMENIGHITDDAIIPIFGHTPFKHNPDVKVAACEVYIDKKAKLLTIQFRTIVVMEYAGPFLKKMSKMLKEWNVERIIVLSSAVQYDHEGTPLQYDASESFKKAYMTELDATKWREHSNSEIVGGGNDKLLLKVFEKFDLPVMILYSLVGFPTDAVEEKVLFHQITDLVKNFLKYGDNFDLTLPIGWNFVAGNEIGEMMY